jgi:excisionase family DNA binding protein
MPRRRNKPLNLDAAIMTVAEVADYLRVSPSTIYRLLKNGELRGFKVGDWRFNRQTLDDYMREQATITQARGKHT